MARCMQFDAQDRAALRKLDDDFTFSNDGETASITGEMTVEIVRVRPADGDQFWVTIRFPGDETLDARIARTQLLQELGVES